MHILPQFLKINKRDAQTSTGTQEMSGSTKTVGQAHLGPLQVFPSDSEGKESVCQAGDLNLIPRSGRPPGEGNGYPL